MAATWSSTALQRIGMAEELRIGASQTDGTWRRPVPIWVVCLDQRVYVRTWHRRSTGWFGQVLASQRAQISVPGLDVAVAVADIGAGSPELRTGIDDAYRAKYGHHGDATVAHMVDTSAAASTLELTPE